MLVMSGRASKLSSLRSLVIGLYREKKLVFWKNIIPCRHNSFEESTFLVPFMLPDEAGGLLLIETIILLFSFLPAGPFNN